MNVPMSICRMRPCNAVLMGSTLLWRGSLAPYRIIPFRYIVASPHHHNVRDYTPAPGMHLYHNDNNNNDTINFNNTASSSSSSPPPPSSSSRVDNYRNQTETAAGYKKKNMRQETQRKRETLCRLMTQLMQLVEQSAVVDCDTTTSHRTREHLQDGVRHIRSEFFKLIHSKLEPTGGEPLSLFIEMVMQNRLSTADVLQAGGAVVEGQQEQSEQHQEQQQQQQRQLTHETEETLWLRRMFAQLLALEQQHIEVDSGRHSEGDGDQPQTFGASFMSSHVKEVYANRGREALETIGHLVNELLLKTVGRVQTYPPTYSPPYRVMHIIRCLLDVAIFTPTSSMKPRWVAPLISRMREHLTLRSKALLCAMGIDGILVHQAPPRWKDSVIKNILRKSRDLETPIDGCIVSIFVSRPFDNFTHRRWTWLMTAADRGLVEMHPMVMSYYLVESCKHNAQKTADAIIHYAQRNHHLLDSAVVYQILSVFNSRRQPDLAKHLWDTLKIEDVKWHGKVLNQMLFISVSNKRRDWWEGLLRQILERCENNLKHGKTSFWTTAFFDTQTQLEIFTQTSNNMIDCLELWSKNNDDPDLSVMASRWRLFVEDQFDRFTKIAK